MNAEASDGPLLPPLPLHSSSFPTDEQEVEIFLMPNPHPSNHRSIGKVCLIALFLIFTYSPLALSQSLRRSLGERPTKNSSKKESPKTSVIKLISSDQNSITLELTVAELETDVKEIDGVRYQAVSYSDCGFTSEAGNPCLPVSRTFIGIPPDAAFRVEVMNAVSSTRGGYRLPPVPHQVIKREGTTEARLPEMQSIVGKFTEDGLAYQKNAFYPQKLAEVIYEGYIRDQKIINLELRPVQYNPKTRSVKFSSRILARVVFAEGLQAAPASGRWKSIGEESLRFENFFSQNLINYDQAKHWRQARPQPINAAPAMENAPVYKIYVEETGIYRLTYEDLKNDWGLDLAELDPRNFRLRLRGNEIPIYVHGESDGKFNQGDYIEFLGEATNAIYTRWNVYWLDAPSLPLDKGGLGGILRRRVAEVDGAPSDSMAKLVSTFHESLHFEEDHFHSTLQHVLPDDVSPGDPHGWYEAADHWFWTGIKNNSDVNEVELKFKLYDVAPTLEQPKIEVVLTGKTPVLHRILTAINGIKIADSEWSSQDEIRISKSLRRMEKLVDGTQGFNVLRCVRIDTQTNDDSLNYPFHIYINSFNVQYTRLLKAVNDYLAFSAPEGKDEYSVRERRKLEFTIAPFLHPEVEIFETDGSVLLAKIRNPKVEEVRLTPEERQRLRVIFEDNLQRERELNGLPEEEEHFAAPALNDEDVFDVPYAAYNVTFQYPDSRHDRPKFIAVSPRGTLKPVNVVKDENGALKDMSNGADYIIITHPVFMAAAQKLGEWRKTDKGGTHRVKVVDVTDAYDEFNHGQPSPQAIKDFLDYAYFNWQPPAPTYALIIGDATFDFRGIMRDLYPEPPETLGYIPTHYVWTTFGETSSDHWFTTVSGIDALPDFYLGRIPVETPESAEAVIDKIIRYENSRPNGSWRRLIVSIADDDATNSGDDIFRRSLSEISQNYTLLGFETTKLFLEEVIDEVNANPTKYGNLKPGQVMKEIITEELGKGAVLAQYAGHGGRFVWAHEIIFDRYAALKLEPTEKLPFLLVFSCYNGYFDKAHKEPSMTERLLRLPNGGILGMLSATRLTYGPGNDALNKIIFDNIFKHNMRGLGEISFDSKTELLINDGMGQFEVMQQYTLFGDPASRVAMADYEVTPELITPAVKAGGTLRIAPGKIYHSDYDERQKQKIYTHNPNFNGKLIVVAKCPGDVEVTEEFNVKNGEYPAIELDIPGGVEPGKGIVEYYAENSTEIAVGGVVFTVEMPIILEINEELVGNDAFKIAAKVADYLNITDIKLEWHNPTKREWEIIPMAPDLNIGAGWYSTVQPLPPPEDGIDIRYRIIVKNADDTEIASEYRTFRPLEIPNFRVVETLERGVPIIYYADGTIKAEIENTSDIDVTQPVEVHFYEGNPDVDEDSVADENAKLLGRATLSPQDWQRLDPILLKKVSAKYRRELLDGEPLSFTLAPLNTNRIAVAALKYTLPIGNHLIFAWVDQAGDIKEERTSDNITIRLIEVNGYRLSGQDIQAYSLDRIIELILPANSADDNTVVSVSALKAIDVPQAVNQPLITPIGLPEGENAGAYQLKILPPSAFRLPPSEEGIYAADESEYSMFALNKPAIAELKFDLAALRENIKMQIGLGDTPYSELDSEQQIAIEGAVQEAAKDFAVYLWHEPAKKWVKLDSALVSDSQGGISHPASRTTKNTGDGKINTVNVDEEITPEGDWVLMFTARSKYRLLFAEAGGTLREVISNADIATFPQDAPEGMPEKISVSVTLGEEDYEFGDTFRFTTTASMREGQRHLGVSYIGDRNEGDGIIQSLTVEENAGIPVDKWVIFFVDKNHFQVEGERTGVVKQDGKPKLGAVGEAFFDPAFGLRVTVINGEYPFAPGDRFKFETKEVGVVRANTPYLGTFSLMSNADTIPPDMQFGVGKQNFIDGAPISQNPNIHIIIGDDSGIDLIIRQPELSISHNDGDFEPIPASEYIINSEPGANQAVLNYSPTLEYGKYELQLIARDTVGNESKKSVSFRVNTSLQLLEVMNYPNPFKEKTTITCEVTTEIDEIEVKIYTLSGRLIRRLSPEEQKVGFIMADWYGRDEDDDEVANGIYYGKVTVKREGQKTLTEVIKMMKLK